ncbi:3911_t:CDS:2, partial [Diversispora eburnea]
MSFMETIENEILIKIISYLLPQDLYSLTLINKRYRSLLWSISPTTQTIWRNSRTQYLNYPSLPPPLWMSEQKYIWFTLLARSCQLCSAPVNAQNIFPKNWEFGIICCNKCFDQNTISVQRCVDNGNALRIFWRQDLVTAEQEFLYLYENVQRSWVEQKQKRVLELMEQ